MVLTAQILYLAQLLPRAVVEVVVQAQHLVAMVVLAVEAVVELLALLVELVLLVKAMRVAQDCTLHQIMVLVAVVEVAQLA
jgi:hypothetical protein